MPLRPARTADLLHLSNVYASAFDTERVMGVLMHPYRETYPQDYRRYWKARVREWFWFWDWRHVVLVAYDVKDRRASCKEEMGVEGGDGGNVGVEGDRVEGEGSGEGEEVVTGVADWIRHGEGLEGFWGARRGTWYLRNLITNLVKLRHRICSYFYPNRAADPAMLDLGTAILPFIKHHWTGPRANGWYLNFLAVDPEYQKQGYGRELVRWGIEKAKQANVTASVISGERKDDFYRRCGFEVVVGNSTEGEGNPLKGKADGGTVLFWDPPLRRPMF